MGTFRQKAKVVDRKKEREKKEIKEIEKSKSKRKSEIRK
jgi:hypothetical protein